MLYHTRKNSWFAPLVIILAIVTLIIGQINGWWDVRSQPSQVTYTTGSPPVAPLAPSSQNNGNWAPGDNGINYTVEDTAPPVVNNLVGDTPPTATYAPPATLAALPTDQPPPPTMAIPNCNAQTQSSDGGLIPVYDFAGGNTITYLAKGSTVHPRSQATTKIPFEGFEQTITWIEIVFLNNQVGWVLANTVENMSCDINSLPAN